MMWDKMAALITAAGGEIRLSAPVERVEHDGSRATGLQVGGERLDLGGASLVSSAPLRELILHMEPEPPAETVAAARALRFRGLLTIALVIEAADLFPDNWIYIHEPAVELGRIQNPKNWSPEMAPDPALTCLGLEYFCWTGEGLWERSDEDLIARGERELTTIGLLHGERVRGGKVVRLPHAYPVYDPGYQERLGVLRAYLAGFENLQVIGRAGMHRYNNMDHSMLTGLLAARNLTGEHHDLWQVNLEEEYHEEEQKT
jgi:protoporphyrinogen oxidase